MSDPVNSTQPTLEKCPVCGGQRSSRASACVHCGDREPSPPGRLEKWERGAKLAAILAIPLLTALIGHFQWRQNHAFQEAKRESEEFFRERAQRMEEQDRLLLVEQQRANDERQRAEHALQLLQHLASDEERDAQIATLMALCFTTSDQLDPNVITVLVHRADQNPTFCRKLKETIALLLEEVREQKKDQKLIAKFEWAMNRVDTRRALMAEGVTLEQKREIAKDALEGHESRRPHASLASAKAILEDKDLKRDPSMREAAKEVITSALENNRGDTEVLEEAVKKAIEISESGAAEAGASEPAADLVALQSHIETVARTEIPKARRVELIEELEGPRERFVVVFSEDRDHDEVGRLRQWASDHAFRVAIWNTRDIGKEVERPARIELRYCRDNPRAEERAGELRSEIAGLIGRPPLLKGLPPSVIAENEYEVWFPN